MLISSDDDYVFVREFNGFKKHEDGLFAYVYAWSFPRDSRMLRFRLEERENRESGQWNEVTTFIVKNPNRSRIESWKPQKHPQFQLPGDIDVQIGELVVRAERSHPLDIWENVALLTMRLSQGGQVLTNWGIRNTWVWDASGNFDSFGASKVITNEWIRYRAHRPLDPKWPWRFEVGFAMDSNFAETNLYSFTLSWPPGGNVQTNFAGIPIRVGRNQWALNVELLEKDKETRLTFVSVHDEEGKDVTEFGGNWGQHHFSQRLSSSASTNILAIIAIHPNYPAEFILQPRHEKSVDEQDQAAPEE
jgi:hypothetical protein